MNIPEILGVEVMTPDGRGSVLSLHNGKVHICLNKIMSRQIMIGDRRSEMHYAYDYDQVTVIKGQYSFDEEKVKFNYN